MSAGNTPPTPDLASVRREIDEIDDRLLALLEARFAAVARVRAAKEAVSGAGRAAFRPAREAAVLRRLAKQRGPSVPLELMVRLWRIIMGAATQMQDGLQVFASRKLLSNPAAAALLGTQFSRLSGCEDAASAIRASGEAGLAAVWVEESFAEHLGVLQVIGALGASKPEIFLVGSPSLAEASGEDETLLASPTVPANAQWSAHGLCGVPGFLEANEAPHGSYVLGRYPRLDLV
jgi:chorismate mutase